MSNPLAIYLHDHLAGSHFALQLLGTLQKQHEHEQLGIFSTYLLADVKEDQEVLEAIIHEVGETHVDLKNIAAWAAEKATQSKLRRDRTGALGTFEALEALALGITGKLALWQVLPVVAETDPRLRTWDFELLATRAREQYSRVESCRLALARAAFSEST